MGELERSPWAPVQVSHIDVLVVLRSDITVILTDDPNVVLARVQDVNLVIRRHPRRGLIVQAFGDRPEAIWAVWFEREQCPDVIERWWPGDPPPALPSRRWWQRRKAIR